MHRIKRGIQVVSKTYTPSDAGDPTFVQHGTEPGWIVPWCSAQVPSVEGFLLPMPQHAGWAGTDGTLQQVPIQWLLTLTFRLLKTQGRGPVEQTRLFNLPKSLKTAPSTRLAVQTWISPVARLIHRVQPATDPWTPSLRIHTSSHGSIRGCWHHTHTSHPQSHSSCRTQTPITDTQEIGI